MEKDDFYSRVGTDRYGDSKASYGLNTAGNMPVPQQDFGKVELVSMKRWSAANGIFRGAAETYDTLPSALYRTGTDPYGNPILIQQSHDTDGLLELPDDASASILAEFDDFWERRESFTSRGFLHKRGFMLWGPPGSGKTSCVNLLIRRIIKDQGGIVLFLDVPNIAALCLRQVRLIEPERPIVAVMEDLDALIMRHGEHEYLSLLDGEAQVDRIAFLATTNYPEKLDRRFCDRPSRFDTIKYIGMPSYDARKTYLSNKEPSLAGDELANWVELTDGFSLAHLKELIVSVKCLGQPLDVAIDRLESMRVSRPNSEDEPTRLKAGFIGLSKRNGASLGVV